MTRAIALERSLIAGTAAKNAASQGLAEDLAGHLRSLLRDVICGHLDPDLAVIADELLEPDELLHVDDEGEAEPATRRRPEDAEGVAPPSHAPVPAPEATDRSDVSGRGELRVRRIREVPLQVRHPEPMQGAEPGDEDGFAFAEEPLEELDFAGQAEEEPDLRTDGVHAVDSFGEAHPEAHPDLDPHPDHDPGTHGDRGLDSAAAAPPEADELPIDGVVSTFS